ncbi:protein PLANT CADMIUM RESISTANCE 2-like [Prosopis cineraria]|uniref:protein PLANT CADMIUM RESISTANCE 2-like n=1 Tax=Prosopis cineraria TaxID=364024 RepID=UPI0024103F07|nr:protein PLANT CADMIUM RESISTANCE 2-like [Prosopis cineraria]
MAEKPQLSSWSSGLCGCFSDCEACCITFWCPCITFGRIAEIVDRGATSCLLQGALFYILGGFTHFVSFYSCIYRTKLRKLYKIEGSETCDCIVSSFCPHMALCQEYRELKARGFDMSAGWQGNVELQTPGAVAVTAPVVQGGMSR